MDGEDGWGFGGMEQGLNDALMMYAGGLGIASSLRT